MLQITETFKHVCLCVVCSEGAFSVSLRERKPKETRDRDHSGPFGRRGDGRIVCQAAQLNRNNDLHVSSFIEKVGVWGMDQEDHPV